MFSVFFFNDTATTEIYTLSLHDALPIFLRLSERAHIDAVARCARRKVVDRIRQGFTPRVRSKERHTRAEAALHFDLQGIRSEEHTSELQSRQYLVCRLLLEKKKRQSIYL